MCFDVAMILSYQLLVGNYHSQSPLLIDKEHGGGEQGEQKVVVVDIHSGVWLFNNDHILIGINASINARQSDQF
jgi:hypothetical protein